MDGTATSSTARMRDALAAGARQWQRDVKATHPERTGAALGPDTFLTRSIHALAVVLHLRGATHRVLPLCLPIHLASVERPEMALTERVRDPGRVSLEQGTVAAGLLDDVASSRWPRSRARHCEHGGSRCRSRIRPSSGWNEVLSMAIRFGTPIGSPARCFRTSGPHDGRPVAGARHASEWRR